MSSLLVEVCKVDKIEKHPNADKLSIVTVKGWNCIVSLEQYKQGDLVVFIPPDCIIPDALIEKYGLEYLKKNGRTGTLKLRGFISQGLILDSPEGVKEGKDVAGLLGITKWEPPEAPAIKGARATSKKRSNPLFDKYTEIENIKNFKGVFQEGDLVVVSEKIHGCNSRYGCLPISVSSYHTLIDKLVGAFKKYVLGKKFEYVYGSHNVQLTMGSPKAWKKGFYKENVWEKVGTQMGFLSGEKIPEGCIIYGEIYGKKIQDLEYGEEKVAFRAFDVKANGRYLDHEDFVQFCVIREIPMVPVLFQGSFYEGLLEHYTSGKSVLYPKQIREGIVIKSATEEVDRRIGRKILKSISVDYLTRKNGSEYK